MSRFCIIPAAALTDERLSHTDIRVLCAIGIHVDRDGAGCFASGRTLADEAGVRRNHFFVAAANLLKCGYIERVSGKADGGSSTYAIVYPEREKGSPKSGLPHSPKSGPRVVRKATHPQSENGTTTSINAPFNDPSNAPTTRGGKLGAAEVLKDVRMLVNPRFPGSLERNWTDHFSEHEVRVIRAVGIERILNTQPANDGPLLAHVASMLAEVHA